MAERPDWAPEGIDTETFSAARVYDYMLGGSHNFAVDRELAREAIAILPDLPIEAQVNRAFLRRAVRYLVDAGVRQFLDIGSGIPTRGNVHEVAQAAAPEARVVYVDIDPVAVAHSQHILTGNDRAAAIQADLLRPEAIRDHPQVRALLDFDQPVAVLLLAILHAVGDEVDPYGVVARIRDTLAPGSYLVVSQVSQESHPDAWERLVELMSKTPYPVFPRGRSEVAGFFDGFELVEPGVSWAPLWHPEHPDDVDDDSVRSISLVGVGRRQ